MTPLEFILTFIIWLFVANFICRKRNWYKSKGEFNDDRHLAVLCAFCLTPIVLIIAIIREFIIRDWDKLE